ncbi:carboxyltransferase domain-containing protein, partial [Pelagibacterales bacterium SAG-MED17]|nr:carboxyltransferase domain-containing protein [Pelagibacterales bacterium SAG-MED17]
MIKNISNLGDAALYCDFGDDVNKEINRNVIQYFINIKNNNLLGITNITPSYNKLVISFDLKLTNFAKLKKEVENLDLKKINNSENTLIKIPVCCEKEFALDITRLEKLLKINEAKIYETFFSKNYYCYMTGFIAGMPFLGDIDKSLFAKRLETPRVKVPKNSIGLTEQFCNIYTFESPGGWNIIGKTPIDIFDNKKSTEPNMINPGNFCNHGAKPSNKFSDNLVLNKISP